MAGNEITLVCQHCAAPFVTRERRSAYCSTRCGNLSRPRKSIPVRLAICSEDGPNGCRNWIGTILRSGYGQMKVGKTKKVAHRVAWETANGPIPPGMCICHHCDNPRCINVSHLFIGTHADNMADMAAKGRAPGRPKKKLVHHRVTVP